MTSLKKSAPPAGQVLIGVVMLLVVLLIMVPAIVSWIQQESRVSVKDQKSTVAFNLASAAVDRGMWKLKSTTTTYAAAAGGTAISGYNFDATYTDVPGGTYRIRFSSTIYGEDLAVMVWGEGRDSLRKETRSIQAVFRNTSVPGAVMSGGALSISDQAIVHWGPVLAWNDITVAGTVYNKHYPRKISKQVVKPHDNSVDPPNTDNLEWWSNYDVPDLPILDFDALRSSAIATNTLNCNGSVNGTTHQLNCNSACVNCEVNFCSTSGNPCDNRADKNFVWYWDRNLNLHDGGINGTVIVLGNLNYPSGSDDWYGNLSGPTGTRYNMRVPRNAWLEYQKIDTNSANQYPADNGRNRVLNNYVLGSNPTAEVEPTGSDAAFVGFVYVGGNATLAGAADQHGAIWVKGNWSSGTSGSSNNNLFYNDQLQLPMLNVVLLRLSWKEVSPCATAWQ